VKLVSHDEIYKNCDIITVHTPLNDETRNMISERELAMMKDGVIIVNAARGGIIDEEALLKYLESGKVTGAAIDVSVKSPPRATISSGSSPMSG